VRQDAAAVPLHNNPKKVEALYTRRRSSSRRSSTTVSPSRSPTRPATSIRPSARRARRTRTAGRSPASTTSIRPARNKTVCQRKDRLINYCCDGTNRPAFIPTNAINHPGYRHVGLPRRHLHLQGPGDRTHPPLAHVRLRPVDPRLAEPRTRVRRRRATSSSATRRSTTTSTRSSRAATA